MIKSYHPDEFDGARGKDRSASCLTSSSHFLTPPPPPFFFALLLPSHLLSCRC